ncbi:MAG: EF-P beta-lysylation protein EpmB, partial [Pirellulaceae bacterium]
GAELARRLGLPEAYVHAGARGARPFSVFAPLGYVARMKPGDPHDPLLRQVLQLAAEEEEVDGFTADPVGDQAAVLTAGLLQKYRGRALMITTGTCAIHCRYCFRRHFPYQKSPHSLKQWQDALDHLAADETIEEVILSGGDPLTLLDSQLAAIVGRLDEIPHLRRLRVHTRLPIVIPERVTADLITCLRNTRLTSVIVVHANHPAELDEAVSDALSRLIDAGLPVLNQAVLLRGVNDCPRALAELCRRLVNLRVIPYYLHQLDRVAGAAHFEVPTEKGLQLVNGLRRILPGYAVPRYVQETPGAPHKVEVERA